MRNVTATARPWTKKKIHCGDSYTYCGIEIPDNWTTTEEEITCDTCKRVHDQNRLLRQMSVLDEKRKMHEQTLRKESQNVVD